MKKIMLILMIARKVLEEIQQLIKIYQNLNMITKLNLINDPIPV